MKAVSNRDMLKAFRKQVQIEGNIDFPTIAKELGIDFKLVQRELAKQGWFYKEMDAALQQIKHSLLNSVLQVAQHGRGSGHRIGDLSAIKWTINMIDAGTLLSVPELDGEADKKADKESTKELMAGLQLGSSSKDNSVE